MTVFSGVSLHAPKTGMSITKTLNISELLLMYLFWRAFETPDINLSETLHGEILSPGSGRKKTRTMHYHAPAVGILC